MPSVWVVTILLVLSVAINSLYLYSTLMQKKAAPDEPLPLEEEITEEWEICTTLIYHTHYTCAHTPTPCCYNGTWYSICPHMNECYDPRVQPAQTWLVARSRGDQNGPIIAQTRILTLSSPGSILFDICKAVQWPTSCGTTLSWHRTYSQSDIYICPYQNPGERGKWDCSSNVGERFCPYWGCVLWATYKNSGRGTNLHITRALQSDDCTIYNCNWVNITIPNPQTWINKYGPTLGIRIYAQGTDPGGIIHLSIETRKLASKSHSKYFSEFWQEVDIEFQPSHEARNLFLELASTIAHTFNVTNCYICGGTKIGDQWPWAAQEWNYSIPYNLTAMPPHQSLSRWELTNPIVAHWCLASTRGTGPLVGETECLEVHEWNRSTKVWDCWPNRTNLFWADHYSLENATEAPPGVHWICGDVAYSSLPTNWRGACTLGVINPSFFMMPLNIPQTMNANQWQGRRLKADYKIGDWKDDEWPPERIIHYYDPAMWAVDGSWGYRTPIYMLNRIIRLQAVVELIANETAQSLRTLAVQQKKFRDAIYQNRLALDYLLATEGGVCGKFNFTNCCLEFDEVGEIIEQRARRIEALAHVPVQKWNGLDLGELFGTWFPKLPGLQAIVALVGLIAAGCVILPCILPNFVRTISSSLSLLVEKKTTEKIMALWARDPSNTYEELLPLYPPHQEYETAQ
uniref:Envelope glycoprotein n=1 Tax=Pseudonaja textilis TaxID=8673 RepID=A0A670ZB44_PSETE